MKTFIISLKIFLFFTILTGVVYPLIVTGIVKIVFPYKANGSLLTKNNKKIGSELIGQQFESPKYFTSRPSAISYNPMPSGGSNYGLTNSKLFKQVEDRKQKFLNFNKLDKTTIIPSEMLFASASGVDPHISKQSALLQVNRIAFARNFNLDHKQKLIQIINDITEAPQYMCLGQERINVLILNMELDKLDQKKSNN